MTTNENGKPGAANKTIIVGKVSGNLHIGPSPEYEVSSVINELLMALSAQPFSFKVINRKPSAKTIVKIKYNNLMSRNSAIRQYVKHSKKIEDAYLDIDSQITFGKNTILSSLNDLYYFALDDLGIDYISSEINIDDIKENSEYIFDFIVQKLKNTVYESSNTPKYKEQIDLGINVVVAHAFVECIVMENPLDDSDQR